jgi:hypothetical protein
MWTRWVAAALACVGTALAGVAAEPPAKGETLVKVLRGTLVLENPAGTLGLDAGQQGRMTAGEAPRALDPKNGTPAIPPAAPMNIEWQPAEKVLRADGQPIPLRLGANGEYTGQSADEHFSATLDVMGTLKVTDTATKREALRRPDGSWTHRFGNVVLDLDATGQATVRLPGGKSLSGANAASPARTRRIGVGLDRNIPDRLIIGVVAPGSPAANAGLRVGDEILKVGDKTTPPLATIQELVSHTPPGEKLRFTVHRAGRQISMDVEVPAAENPEP